MIPAARNNTCEVIINVRGLKIPSANGVENETVMLTPAVNAIMVAYSPRSKPMISISNTGDVLTKVRITETLRVVITTRLRKNRLSSDSLFSRGLSDAAGAAGRVSFKINKDNISTADKMHTTAGSVALADNFARQDAPVVQALRRAGAVILGKTNLSEFARYIAMEFPDGYSSRGGQVKNPYGESLPVSGSSSNKEKSRGREKNV